MGLTFEKVWAALMENRIQIERTQVQLEKTEASVNKMSERVDRVTKNVGGLNRSIGELKEKDIDHHLKRIELIKKYPPAECKGKKILGAMAGGVVDPDILSYAHSAGFFVLELTGESVHLTESPKGFVPRQW